MIARASIIVVLGFVAFGGMLRAPFKTMDDRASIVDNAAIKSAKHIGRIFQEGYFHDAYYYRPLINLSFMAEYALFGLRSFFYNLDNLILHNLNALLVFVLVSRLMSNPWIGFWTGVLFVLHPVQWEAVCNIAGRAIVMSTFFVLSAFILFLKGLDHRRKRYFFLSLSAFFLGLLCKESAAVLPLVLTVYLRQIRRYSWRQSIVCLMPFGGVILGYLGLRHTLGLVQMYQAKDILSLILGFVTFLRSVITDLCLFIYPVDLRFDRLLPFFYSFTYPPVVLTLSFWGAIVITILHYRQRFSSVAIFLMLWFALELFPVSQLITSIGVGSGYVSVAEHFLYLASVPVLLGMVLAFQKLYAFNQRRHFLDANVVKFLAGGFCVFLLCTSIEQSIYASNEYTMINRSLMFEPRNPRLQGAMGMLSVYRGDIPDAKRHFQAAIDAEPLNVTYHISLGSALCQEGYWIEALEQFVFLDSKAYTAIVQRQEKRAMDHIQQQLNQGRKFNAREWLAIGIYYVKIGEDHQALKAFLKSIDFNPRQTDAWFNLGAVYGHQGNFLFARVAYEHVLTLPERSFFQEHSARQRLKMMEHY